MFLSLSLLTLVGEQASKVILIEKLPLLRALADIESNSKDSALGSKGEISRYQILPSTWKSWTYEPLGRAKISSTSSQVASHGLKLLDLEFKTYVGRRPNLKEIYVLWNLGPTKFRKLGFNYKRVPSVVKERAQRFESLVEAYEQARN